PRQSRSSPRRCPRPPPCSPPPPQRNRWPPGRPSSSTSASRTRRQTFRFVRVCLFTLRSIVALPAQCSVPYRTPQRPRTTQPFIRDAPVAVAMNCSKASGSVVRQPRLRPVLLPWSSLDPVTTMPISLATPRQYRACLLLCEG